MAFSTTGNRGQLPQTNVTPLVDAMLVLLMIFIVTAPMPTRPITVDLPQRSDQSQDSWNRLHRSHCVWMPMARCSGMPAR